MQKLFGLLVFIFPGLHSLLAQEKVLSYQHTGLDNDLRYANVIEITPENGFVLTLVEEKSLKRILVNKNKQVLEMLELGVNAPVLGSSFRHSGPISDKLMTFYRRNSIINGVYSSYKLAEILRDKFSYDFCIVETDLVAGKIAMTDTIDSKLSEKIISAFNSGGALYMVTYLGDSDNICIYEKRIGQPCKRSLVTIGHRSFGKTSDNSLEARSKVLSDVFRSNDFLVLENGIRYHPLMVAVRNKAYLRENDLVLTISNNRMVTFCIIIDFRNPSYRIIELDQDLQENENENAQTTSSFLTDSFLVTSHIRKEELFVRVFELYSGKLLRAFDINEENYAGFISEPIEKNGTFLSRSDIKEKKFNRFLDIAKRTRLSLSAYTSEGILHLSFAAPNKQFTNSTTIFNLASTILGTYLINAAPNTYGYVINAYPGSKTATFAGLNTALEMGQLTNSNARPDFSVWEQIVTFNKRSDILPGSSPVFFYMNGHFYAGQYMNDKKYFICRFNEKGFE